MGRYLEKSLISETTEMEMVARLTEKNIETFANENNVWRSRHLRLEAEGILGEIER